MEENMKYEEAMAQIETIVHKMENNELLIKFCKDKLTKTEEELSKIQAEQA